MTAMALVLGEGLHSIARMAQDKAPSAREPGVICSTTGSTQALASDELQSDWAKLQSMSATFSNTNGHQVSLIGNRKMLRTPTYIDDLG